MKPDTSKYQQIPLTTNWRTTDNVSALRQIMQEHERGVFLNSSVFWEEALSDDRIGAVIDTRIGGLLSADLHFKPSAEKRRERKLADLLGGSDQTEDDGLWLRMIDPDVSAELLKWKLGLGVAFGPIVWDTKDGQWVPRVVPWHPRHLWWDWSRWQFAVVSWGEPMVWLPRTDENPRGDGKWFIWGGYRSWMTGLVRSLGVPYIDRSWTQRDAARYSEKYGLNIIEGKVPAGASEEEKGAFRNTLANIGSEPTIICPQGRTKDDASFSIELHEPTAQGWQIFKTREDALNTNIAVRVLGQNLTTEVKGGSLAASKVHEAIRADVKRRDAHFFKAVREQLLCWWTLYNFGDAEIAPYPKPELSASPDPLEEAQEMLVVMQALQLAPPELDSQAVLEAHGFPTLEGELLEEKLARTPTAAQGGQTKGPSLTATAAGSIMTVNEARKQQGLPPLAADGELTIAEYQAKHASTISAAVAAESGQSDGSETTETLALLSRPAQLVALKAGTTCARRQAKYHEAVSAIARRRGGKALHPLIEQTLAIIDQAKSFDDIKRLVVKQARSRGAGVDELAKIVERVNVLAHLKGRQDALASVVK